MVEESEITEFGEQVRQALIAAGYSYLGKVELTPEKHERYKGMNMRAIVAAEVEERENEIKSALLKILEEIRETNRKGKLTYPCRDRMQKFGLNYDYYLFIFRYLKNQPLVVEGELGQRTYKWTVDREPTIEDAEVYYKQFQITKRYSLSNQQVEVISRYHNEPIDQIMEVLERQKHLGASHYVALMFKTLKHIAYMKVVAKKAIENEIKRKLAKTGTVTSAVIGKRKIENDIDDAERQTETDHADNADAQSNVKDSAIETEQETKPNNDELMHKLMTLNNQKVELYRKLHEYTEQYYKDILRNMEEHQSILESMIIR